MPKNTCVIFYYFLLSQAILDYSVKYSLCNLREAFNDSILTNRLEAKTEKEKYTVFCRCRQSVCVLLLLLLFC